jgi:hypothetical protein
VTRIQWLEVPIRLPAHRDATAETKYQVGDAVVVYRDELAYVGLADQRAAEELLAHPDVRALSAREMERVQPIPGLSLTWASLENQVVHLGKHPSRRHPLGLGDAIALVARRFRIPECGSCAQRHGRLNKITIWGWWRQQTVPKKAHEDATSRRRK